MSVKPEQAARMLLYRLRKEMNGAALDTMRYYGRDYGRNYGCQIYAIRAMAREVGVNHSLAEYLYEQDVRELKIIALWIADSAQLTRQSAAWWLERIHNSELAEQASHALLSRLPFVGELLEEYAESENSLVVYALLLAAARNADVAMGGVSDALVKAVACHSNNALVARAVAKLLVAHCSAAAPLSEQLQRLPDNPTTRLVREEVAL